MTDLEKLGVEEVSSLVTSSVEEFKEKVEERDLEEADLKALKSAEKSGKDREKVLNFLDNQIEKVKISENLGIAEKDIGEVQKLIGEVSKLEEADFSEDETADIDQDRLIELVGGTVDDVKEFVEDENPSVEVLNLLLSSEEKVKDRKTAKSFIERKIRKKKVEKDLENTKEDIENLEEDIESIESDSSLENPSRESEESEEGESETSKEKEDEDEESDQSSNEEDKDSKENRSENEEKEEDKEDMTDLERKKEIVEDLEVDFSDEKLGEISFEELEEIRDEKKERDQLISKLEEEGLDREKLENSSTSDLRKIAEELDDENHSETEEKSEEEIREEAEEDLQMLMGAVSEEEEGDENEEKGTREKLDNLKERISSALDRSSDEESEETSGMNDSEVKKVLDKYSDLENDEAAIKTAHVVKGYLETELGIEKELTYKELSEEMPDSPKEMKELGDFFEEMHTEQYTQNIDVDSGEVIELSKRVVDDI